MTWSAFTTDGSGELQLRLVIEGCPDQWVTHPSLAGSVGDGRTRRFGLMPSQIEISERAILQEAELELSGMTLTIEERDDNAATYAFARNPRVLAWIGEEVGVLDPETFDVDGNTKIAVNQYVHAGTEAFQVTAKPTSTTITIARAKWQSQIQKHFIEVGAEEKSVAITDAPGAIRGRRAFLYAHGVTELSPTAAGTLIWRGIVAAHPELDALVRWRIRLDPITVLLEQELAADTDRPAGISGAYYPWSLPIRYQINEWSAPGASTVSIPYIVNTTGKIYVNGYFATREDLEAALNASLPSLAGWTNADYKWQVDADGHPVLAFTTDASSPKLVSVDGGSRIDGSFRGSLTDATGTTPPLGAVAAATTYYARCATDGDLVRSKWPRAWLGDALDNNVDEPRPALRSTHPSDRIYLNDTIGATAADAISGNFILDGTERHEQMIELSAVGQTATENDVRLDRPSASMHEALDGSTEIRLTRKYTSNFDLVQFRDDVIDAAIDKNKGSTPNVTGEDLALWTEAADAAQDLGPFATQRDYFFSRPVAFAAVIKEEAKILGGFFTTDANSKIVFRRFRTPTRTESSVLSIDDSMILTNSLPAWATEKGGIVNHVVILTGYDAVEDKHVGDVFHIRNVQSISEHSRSHELEIAPYSIDHARLEPKDAKRIADTPLGFFNKFHILELDVSWKAWSARLGDTVTVTCDKLPDPYTGTRGLLNARATVIGRRWTIPGFGRLTLLLHAKRVAGYAPSANVVTSTHLGSNVHRVTCTQNFYAPSGVNDLSFFQDGDHVETYQLDFSSPAVRTGTVVGTPTATTIDVNTGAATTFSGADWVLHLRDRADTYTPSENAAKYVWIADSANNLYNGDDAYQYAP